LDLRGGGFELKRPRQEALSGACQHDALASALEQPGPEVLFEVREASTHRRQVDAQRAGCPPERPLTRERQEDAVVVPREVGAHGGTIAHLKCAFCTTEAGLERVLLCHHKEELFMSLTLNAAESTPLHLMTHEEGVRFPEGAFPQQSPVYTRNSL